MAREIGRQTQINCVAAAFLFLAARRNRTGGSAVPQTQTPYKRFNIDVRTGQILATLQSAAIADDQLISSKQLAALFGVSLPWVEIARHRGEGPKWVAISARCIRYRMVDVIAWLKERGEARAKFDAARKIARMECHASDTREAFKQSGRKA
jgi:predicted DNA-binding transcriptional regulator AlpA